MIPFVSCICVTRSRPVWLELAVEYFLAQTFTDSEMVIVSDGEPPVRISHPRIRVFNLAFRPKTLGEKRNIACEKAKGTVIATWDDDDYSSPLRLHNQLLTLKRFGASVTAYNKMKFTDGQNWWMYNGILPNVGIGSSLMFTKVFWSHNQFDGGFVNQHDGFVTEDGGFVNRAWNKREYVTLPGCANEKPGYDSTDRMYATVHPANTSKRDLLGYRQIGQKRVPDRVIGAFRSVGAAFDGLAEHSA